MADAKIYANFYLVVMKAYCQGRQEKPTLFNNLAS